MADHIHGRINGKLTMIMGDINMKIWFLILAAVVLSGCETAQQARQNEMMEARRMVAAQFGNRLSPAQEAYLTMQVFQRMEAERNENARVSAAIIGQGIANAGEQYRQSTMYQPVYIQPVQMNYPRMSQAYNPYMSR